MTLPLPADINDDGNTADNGCGAAQRRNNTQSQEVADWDWLELLSEDDTVEQGQKTTTKIPDFS